MKVFAVSIEEVYEPAQKFGTLGSFVSTLLPNLYLLAGIIFLFLMIFGGLSLIANAGSGDSQKTASGKNAVTAALLGFLIIFASYWIIQLVEVLTGVTIF